MKKQPRPFLEIHPRDAAKLEATEDNMIEVQSRRGTGRFPARITTAIVPGTVFLPMHWGALWTDDGEANLMTHPEACPISLEPEFKACAVSLSLIKVDSSMIDDNQIKSDRQNNNQLNQSTTESVTI